MDVIIQNKRRKALSVTYGDSSPRERAKAAFSIGPDWTEVFSIKTRNVPICHSDRSVSGVEESTTLEKELPQDITSNFGRFLDSHSLPRNDMSGGWFQLSARVLSVTLHGDESSPLHWVYRIWGNTIHPHVLYLERPRNGIQAVPYILYRMDTYEQRWSPQ